MRERVDEHLLRSLVKGHSKLPLEFLYLEAGAMPIKYILKCRRILYLQTILQRPEEELTRRVYDAQKRDPLHGDFFQLVKDDFNDIDKEMSEIEIKQTNREQFKKEIKEKTRAAAFEYLKNIQGEHSSQRYQIS